MIYIPTKYNKIEGVFDISSHSPHPTIHPTIRKLALRARRVNPVLNPGMRCKGLVETLAATVRARLVTVRARLATIRARLATVRARLA